MQKNSAWKAICAIVGAVVIIGAAVAAIIHFWEDIKAYLPCCCKKDDDFEFDELDEIDEVIEDDLSDFEVV